ncbi:MAG: hypothetical protein ACJ77N_07395 [Chloroflexota bacterium]
MTSRAGRLTIAAVIRNAVIHILNEQPLLADIPALPASTDAGLVCTNLRMLDGRRPVFIDRTESTFFFPYRHIRFIEMPSVSLAQLSPGEPVPVAPEAEAEPEVDLDFDLELDEDFLRRVREA